MAEIELKLALPESQAARALRAVCALPGARAPVTKAMRSVYYDTVKRDLLKAGLTLRVREVDGRFIQTVKGAATGLARDEWEDEIGGHQPDLTVGKSGRVARKHLGKNVKVAAQFSVDVTRRIVMVTRGGATVEVAIDAGEIAGKRRAPISEIELELKSGGEAALYDLALRLMKSLDLVVETRTKSDRGFALGRKAPPAAVRGEPITLKGSWTLGKALAVIARGYLHQFARNIPAALAQRDEGIHQMRVALRRLRSVLGAAKKLMAPVAVDAIDLEIKGVLKGLGGVRDWDVIAAKLKKIPGRRTAAHVQLATLVAKARDEAHDKACAAVRSKAQNVALLDIARWFVRLEDDKRLALPFATAARKMLARQHKRVCKRGRGFEKLDAEQRHKLRIACKTLRYNVELCGQLYPRKQVKAFLKLLMPLQDDLGALNDVHSAHALLVPFKRGHGPKAAVDQVLTWLDRDTAGLEAKATKNVAKLLAAKPFW